MNLTYEASETGYTILNDGKAWIVQDSYIPYPGETMAESAQNHIDEIIEESNKPAPPSPEEELEQLKPRLDATEQALIQIMMEGGI